MYRTRVESVSGENAIDSSGKKLCIIGNRIVRPGDYVYTDGKVIFGNNMDGGSLFLSSSPLLMFGIPLVCVNGYLRAYFDTRLLQLKLTDKKALTQSPDTAFVNNLTNGWVFTGPWEARYVIDENHVTRFDAYDIDMVADDRKGIMYAFIGGALQFEWDTSLENNPIKDWNPVYYVFEDTRYYHEDTWPKNDYKRGGTTPNAYKMSIVNYEWQGTDECTYKRGYTFKEYKWWLSRPRIQIQMPNGANIRSNLDLFVLAEGCIENVKPKIMAAQALWKEIKPIIAKVYVENPRIDAKTGRVGFFSKVVIHWYGIFPYTYKVQKSRGIHYSEMHYTEPLPMGWGDWMYDSVLIEEETTKAIFEGFDTCDGVRKGDIYTTTIQYVETDFDRKTGEVDLKGADIEHISTEIATEFIRSYTDWKEVTDDAYAVITVAGRDAEKKVTYTSHSYKYSVKDAPIIAHYTTVKSSVETATYTYYKVQELTMVPKKTKIEGSEKESIKYPLQDGCYGTLDGRIYDEKKSLVSSTGLEEPVGFYKIKKGIYVLLKKAGNYKNNALYLIQAGKGAEKVGDVTNKKVRPLKALPAYISGR